MWRSTALRRPAGPSIDVPSNSCPPASTLAPPSFTRHLPVASKFSSARPSGSITRWQDVHAGLLRCCSMRSRTESVRPASVVPFVSSSAGTFGGGGGGGDPSSTSITHLPRITGDVRSAIEVSVSTLPWPRMPRRSSGTVTRRNWLPVTLAMP